MDLEQTVRTAFALREPPPDFEEAVMARVAAGVWRASQSRRRGPSRTILVVTLLAVGAAAALLALRLRDTSAPAAADVPPAPLSTPKIVAKVVETSPPQTTMRVPQTAKDKVVPKEVIPAATPFTVRVLPLQNQATDAASTAAAELFYGAILDNLRAVPGLTLIEPGSTGVAPTDPVQYQLTITGMGRRADNNSKFGSGLQADSIRPDGSNLARFTMAFSADIAPVCDDPAAIDPSCMGGPMSSAAYAVNLLRTRLFPPDPLLRQRLQAQLLDPLLDPRRRFKALEDLLNYKAPASDTEEISALRSVALARGAVDLAAAASDPWLRAAVWHEMRDVRNAELVSALIGASRKDPDGDVRAQAVATLGADFANNPQARAALGAVARADSRPLVRALAQRVLTGDAAWKEYILDSLKDTTRPDLERIEALCFHMNLPVGKSSGSWGESPPFYFTTTLVDDDAIRALVDVLPRVAADSPALGAAANSLVDLLGLIEHPAVTDMLLRGVNGELGWLNRFTLVNALAGHGGDPRVRAALEKISSSDTDMTVRDRATKALKAASASAPIQ